MFDRLLRFVRGDAREIPQQRRSVPIIVWDDRLDDPPTEDTAPVVRRISHAEDTDPSAVDADVQPQAPFPPPRPARQRVKPVVVRVTIPEWRALVRSSKGRDDLGDVLRRWAGLPDIER